MVILGGKPFGLFHIVYPADLFVFYGPAGGYAIDGIKAPVHKNAQLCILKPLEVLCFCELFLGVTVHKKSRGHRKFILIKQLYLKKAGFKFYYFCYH